MQFSGSAQKVGAHIDTDAIIPATRLVTTDPEELGRYCMEGLSPEWTSHVQKGDILVAGVNFGCGSSREHAPLAILGAGIPVVIAHSFARIFYRNGFNMGLVLLELGKDVENIGQGDQLSVDVDKGEIYNRSREEVYFVPPLPEFMKNILNKGGLVEYVRERLSGAV
ncbi:MAG: 3-isopropylmalate dehydratase small subunit [Thermodesulfobacteriota bacterium]